MVAWKYLGGDGLERNIVSMCVALLSSSVILFREEFPRSNSLNRFFPHFFASDILTFYDGCLHCHLLLKDFARLK